MRPQVFLTLRTFFFSRWPRGEIRIEVTGSKDPSKCSTEHGLLWLQAIRQRLPKYHFIVPLAAGSWVYPEPPVFRPLFTALMCCICMSFPSSDLQSLIVSQGRGAPCCLSLPAHGQPQVDCLKKKKKPVLLLCRWNVLREKQSSWVFVPQLE